MKKRVVLAVLLDFAARAAGALVLAAPVTAAVAASGIGNFPAGDRLLFERGGLLLVEVARAAWSLLPPLASSSLVVSALVYVALTLPGAMLWTALGEEAPAETVLFLGRAVARVPALWALSGLAFLVQVLVLTLGLSAAGALHGRTSHNEMHADLGALAAFAGAAALALLVGVFRDIASATLVSGVDGSKRALRAGLRVAVHAPFALIRRWFVPAAAGALLVLAAAGLAGALDVGRPESFRFVFVALAHQLAVLGLSVCRAVWFHGAVTVARPQLAGGSDARR